MPPKSHPPKQKQYSLLPEETLARLSSKGDPQAKLALEAKQNLSKLLNSQEDDSMFWIVSYQLAPWLIIEFRKDQFGYVEMLLRIGEGTIRKTITSYWDEIRFWKDLLAKSQGIHPLDSHLMDYFDIAQRKGVHGFPPKSYGEIAKDLNAKVHDALYCHVNPRKGSQPDPQARLQEAKDLLQEFGFREKEIDQICSEALVALRQGEAPYWANEPNLLEEPITRDIVISRLKAYRASRKI